MNKFIKTFIALLGGVDVAFSIFIPITVSLLLITMIDITEVTSIWVISLGGILSSIYRAINVAFLRN